MAVAIPGEVAGLYRAHKMFGGALEWASLLEPSIRLARRGFPIGEALANAVEKNEEAIKADPGLRYNYMYFSCFVEMYSSALWI